MSISSIGSSHASYYALLASRLQSNGLSVQKAALVAGDAKVALEKIAPVQKGPLDKAALRDALESRIAADVASGTLTAEDAQTVNTTLDQMDPRGSAAQNQGLAANASKGKPGHGGGGHGGGGGESGANKTDVSETVTVIGQIKKTTILYTDGTSETTTTTLSNSAKDSKYIKNPVFDRMKASAETNDPYKKTSNYLSTIAPGTLFSFTV